MGFKIGGMYQTIDRMKTCVTQEMLHFLFNFII